METPTCDNAFQAGDVVKCRLEPEPRHLWTIESVDGDGGALLIRWDDDSQSYLKGAASTNGLILVREAQQP